MIAAFNGFDLQNHISAEDRKDLENWIDFYLENSDDGALSSPAIQPVILKFLETHCEGLVPLRLQDLPALIGQECILVRSHGSNRFPTSERHPDVFVGFFYRTKESGEWCLEARVPAVGRLFFTIGSGDILKCRDDSRVVFRLLVDDEAPPAKKARLDAESD